jgi:hypothetical protein
LGGIDHFLISAGNASFRLLGCAARRPRVPSVPRTAEFPGRAALSMSAEKDSPAFSVVSDSHLCSFSAWRGPVFPLAPDLVAGGLHGAGVSFVTGPRPCKGVCPCKGVGRGPESLLPRGNHVTGYPGAGPGGHRYLHGLNRPGQLIGVG